MLHTAILCLMLIYAGLSVAHKSLRDTETNMQATYPNVTLEVYYEALCPYCQQFFATNMADIMSKPDIVDILNLRMVPYGNTQMDSSGVFHCQHGVAECMSDVLMQCLLYKMSDDISAIASGSTSCASIAFCIVIVTFYFLMFCPYRCEFSSGMALRELPRRKGTRPSCLW